MTALYSTRSDLDRLSPDSEFVAADGQCASGVALPRAGDLSIVLDGSGQPVAIIERSPVDVVPFHAVSAEVAARESEGDGSLACWQEAHRWHFGKVCERLGGRLEVRRRSCANVSRSCGSEPRMVRRAIRRKVVARIPTTPDRPTASAYRPAATSPHLMTSIALRLVACSVITYWAWYKHGPEGLVYCSALWALAFTRPIVDGTIGIVGFLRALAYRDVEGQHYVYRGTPIHVVEGDEHHRWLLLTDVRRIVRHLPRDATLGRLFAEGVRVFDGEKAWRIEAETLLAYLTKATTLDSAKFRIWLARSVVYPSRKAREFDAPAREGPSSRPAP